MPFRSATGAFEPGDDDVADFLQDIWRPFATDAKVSGGLGWIEQAAARGSHPDFDFLFSRGTIGTELPPFVFFHTSAKSLWIFTGDGVNTAEDPYDQPGNPMNYPASESYGDPSTEFASLGHQFVNTVVGPYVGYWLFGGATGEYLHCVLKVNSRQYRHFHIGMLKPLHTDLDADSFYVTGHCVGYLGPDDLRGGKNTETNVDNKEHQPYHTTHRFPFQACNFRNAAFSGVNLRNRGLLLYMPNVDTNPYDWYHNLSIEGNADSGARNGTTQGSGGTLTTTLKPIGDVNNTPDAVLFGVAQCSGYGDGLGSILFSADVTFTANSVALIPIYVGVYSDFESDNRMAPVAQIPDVFRINMKTIDPEQEITVGSDTYVCFPMVNKDSNNTLDNEGYTGYEGLAYKKITADAT